MKHVPVASIEQYRALCSAALGNSLGSPSTEVARVVCEQCGPPRWLARVIDGEPYQLLMATNLPTPAAEPVGILLGHPFRHPDLNLTVVCPKHGSVELDPERVRRQVLAGQPSGHANAVATIRVRCGRPGSDSAKVPSTTR